MDEFIRILSSKGKIVISDFSEYGFRIVEKVHLSENSVHTRKNDKDFKDVKEYFIDKRFLVKNVCNKYQQILIISRPETLH